MRRSRLASLALASLALLACPAEPDKAAGGGEPKEVPGEVPARADQPAPTPAYVPPPLLEVPPPTEDSPAIAVRGDVVATLQLPGGSSLGELGQVLDGFKPGSAALARLQLPTMLTDMSGVDLAGADLSGPIAALVVNPKVHQKPLALLVRVADLDALRKAAGAAGQELREREGFALIGPKDVVEAGEAYAFDNLVRQPPHTEIVVYPAPLVEVVLPMIESSFGQLGQLGQAGQGNPQAMFASLGKLYTDLLAGLGKQTDRLVISVSVGQTSTDLYVRLYPLPGTTLAAFIDAQVPADHALLAKLPADTQTSLVMSGILHAGPAMEPMIEMSASMMQAFYPSGLGPDEWKRLMTGMIATFDGTFAAKMTMPMPTPPVEGQPPALPQVNMHLLYGSTDSEASRKAWREMFASMAAPGRAPLELGGMKMSVSFSEAVLEHEGVPVDGYANQIDMSALAPDAQALLAKSNAASQSMYFAAFDKLVAMASSTQAVEASIDAARGKTDTFAPNEALTRALASSKQRGDSFLYYFDFSSLMATLPDKPPFSAMVFSLGKQGPAMSWCISIQK